MVVLTEVERAALGYRNVAMRGSFWMGVRAARRGEGSESPYYDGRTAAGGVTYARAFGNAWRRGYDLGAREGEAS